MRRKTGSSRTGVLGSLEFWLDEFERTSMCTSNPRERERKDNTCTQEIDQKKRIDRQGNFKTGDNVSVCLFGWKGTQRADNGKNKNQSTHQRSSCHRAERDRPWCFQSDCCSATRPLEGQRKKMKQGEIEIGMNFHGRAVNVKRTKRCQHFAHV